MSEAAQIDAMLEMIDTLRKALENLKQASEPPTSGHVIAVPWLSQLGPSASYAPGDCGAACVAMLVNWRGGKVTVDEVGKAIGKAPGYGSLNFGELISAAGKYGITLRHENPTLEQMRADIDAVRPVVVLLDYRKIPLYNRYDARYSLGHYVLLVGYTSDCIIYHDPYWPDHDRGNNKQMTFEDFTRAYSSVAQGNTLANHALRMT